MGYFRSNFRSEILFFLGYFRSEKICDDFDTIFATFDKFVFDSYFLLAQIIMPAVSCYYLLYLKAPAPAFRGAEKPFGKKVGNFCLGVQVLFCFVCPARTIFSTSPYTKKSKFLFVGGVYRFQFSAIAGTKSLEI